MDRLVGALGAGALRLRLASTNALAGPEGFRAIADAAREALEREASNPHIAMGLIQPGMASTGLDSRTLGTEQALNQLRGFQERFLQAVQPLLLCHAKKFV